MKSSQRIVSSSEPAEQKSDDSLVSVPFLHTGHHASSSSPGGSSELRWLLLIRFLISFPKRIESLTVFVGKTTRRRNRRRYLGESEVKFMAGLRKVSP